jgi:hypothetical protein
MTRYAPVHSPGAYRHRRRAHQRRAAELRDEATFEPDAERREHLLALAKSYDDAADQLSGDLIRSPLVR